MDRYFRHKKRQSIIKRIKASNDYRNASQNPDRPPTPDATDESITRRSWEYLIWTWRDGLRNRSSREARVSNKGNTKSLRDNLCGVWKSLDGRCFSISATTQTCVFLVHEVNACDLQRISLSASHVIVIHTEDNELEEICEQRLTASSLEHLCWLHPKSNSQHSWSRVK